jgi:thiol-disulfide isomerase/thioredoxin
MASSIRPMMVTVALSAAAALGYVGYRLLIPEPPPGPAVAPTDATEAASAPMLADALPEFSVGNLAGEPTPIGSWPGRPLIVNFWATWCAPCLREIPLLKAFQVEHPDMQIVGIAVDKADAVASFAPRMEFNYPILVGQNDAIGAATALGVQVLALPITVFTAGDGAILRIHTGEVHAEHLENYAAVIADLGAGRTDRATARARLAGLE